MNTFRVWLRPLGASSRVRVAGVKNARWLLYRLSQSFVFKSSEAIDDDANCCSTFLLPYSSQISRSTVEKLLAGIPEVELLAEPA